MSRVIKFDSTKQHLVSAFSLRNMAKDATDILDKKSGGNHKFISELVEGKSSKGTSEFIYDLSGDVKTEDEKKEEIQRKYIVEAKKKAEVIKKTAFQEGMNKVEPTVNAIDKVLTDLNNIREEFYKNIESEVLKLTLAVSKAVINTEVTINKDVIINVIYKSINKIRGQEYITIKINPKDYNYVCEGIPDIQNTFKKIKHLDVIEDESILRGGCMVESNLYDVFSSIDSNMLKIEDELLEAMKTDGV